MTRFLRALLASALVLSLVAATGCGGGGDAKDANEYVAAVNKAQTDFADSVSKGASGATGADGAKQVFSNLDSSMDKVISDLKAIEPPDEVKDLHNQLIGEIEDFQTAIKKAGDSVGSGDPTKILAAQAEFAKAAGEVGTNITKTISEINTELQK